MILRNLLDELGKSLIIKKKIVNNSLSPLKASRFKPSPSESKFTAQLAAWSAWSPFLPSRSNWNSWIDGSEEPSPFFSNLEPAKLPSVKFLPLGMRKKLSPLCKLSLYLMNELAPIGEKVSPRVVMASRHGESQTIVELLRALARSEPNSPMAFSRSVHNSSIGIWSIASKSKLPHTAISAMEDSFQAGLVESLLQLNSQATSEVLYVYADDVVPPVFRQFLKEPLQPYGAAFLFHPGDSLSFSSSGEGEVKDFLAFMKQLPTGGVEG